MDSLGFLEAIAGYTRNAPSTGSSSADRPIRLATIDPAYNAFSGVYPNGVNPARVTFEGETTLSGKYYPVATGYIPGPNQRVWLVPIGTTYMIAGAVATDQAQGFYDGTATGVEFGGGNYFDTLEGLQLETDANIGGDLIVGGVGARFDIVKPSDTPKVNNTLASDPHLTLTGLEGTWKFEFDLIVSGTSGDIITSWSVVNSTGAWSLKTCWGPSPFTIDTSTPLETRGRDSSPMRTGVHLYATSIPYGMNSASAYTSMWERGIVAFSSGGSITLQWAQETTDAANSTIVRAGSTLSARRIA